MSRRRGRWQQKSSQLARARGPERYFGDIVLAPNERRHTKSDARLVEAARTPALANCPVRKIPETDIRVRHRETRLAWNSLAALRPENFPELVAF